MNKGLKKGPCPSVNSRAIQMADSAMEELQGVCNNGLARCYHTFEDFLYDWYPATHLETDAYHVAMKHILQNYGTLLDQVRARFGFDLREDINQELLADA